MLLVADALTGQDAVNTARAFDERVGITGIVLTRMDGDGRGGAALSMRAVTGKPIKLIGTGEKMDALEEFHPARVANRILGMGDIVTLVEKAAEHIDHEKALRVAEKMRKGKFDLDDLREQLAQMEKIGGIGGMLGMLPGIGKMKSQLENANLDDRMIKRQRAIIEFDDARGTQEPGHPQGVAQEAHRRGLGHEGRGRQQAPQDAPPDGRHDEGHGRRKRGRSRPSATCSASAAECRARSRCSSLPKGCRADCLDRRRFARRHGASAHDAGADLEASERAPAAGPGREAARDWADFPGLGKKK